MVFNVSLNNNSVILWQSFLLVAEIGISEKKTINLRQVTDKFYPIMLYWVHLTMSRIQTDFHSIGGVMVSVLASNAVDRGFEPRSGQTKDNKICFCCFCANHAALRRKSKDLLAQNQNNVSKWSNMSIRRLLFQWASTIKIQLSVLV